MEVLAKFRATKRDTYRDTNSLRVAIDACFIWIFILFQSASPAPVFTTDRETLSQNTSPLWYQDGIVSANGS